MEITKNQWEKVKREFDDVQQVYKDLVGVLGVNTTIALFHVFAPLQRRYEDGERTQELYDAMSAVE